MFAQIVFSCFVSIQISGQKIIELVSTDNSCHFTRESCKSLTLSQIIHHGVVRCCKELSGLSFLMSFFFLDLVVYESLLTEGLFDIFLPFDCLLFFLSEQLFDVLVICLLSEQLFYILVICLLLEQMFDILVICLLSEQLFDILVIWLFILLLICFRSFTGSFRFFSRTIHMAIDLCPLCKLHFKPVHLALTSSYLFFFLG